MSTINDVSRLAGVSKATVSRVLSGSRGVKEASRQAVLQAAEELNYRPNMIAQSLLSQTTGCIGVICAQDNINQTTSYLYALQKQLSQHQKHLLLRFANSRGRVLHSLEELTCGLCDNVLIIGARFPLNIDRPDVVLIDCLESEGANSIHFDHAFAAETACNYLISQGNNATTLNFNALLVANEQQAQLVVPQLQAFNRAVPEKVMVFSLAGSLQLPGIPTIPAIEYSMDAMASRIVNWLTEKTQMLGSSPLRGDLIIPNR